MARGIWGGGYRKPGGTAYYLKEIDYVTIESTGNAADFGDLTETRRGISSCSNGNNDRGVFAGGYDGPPVSHYWDVIDYVTISTTGNATDFGDLADDNVYSTALSNGSNERGVFAGGEENDYTTMTNRIQYITINSTGNTTDFGDLAEASMGKGATSNGNAGRGLIAGGDNDTTSLISIECINIASTGNSTNFGDLLERTYYPTGNSNMSNNRGIFAGGGNQISNQTNVIQYMNIECSGSSTDFGDLTQQKWNMAGLSNGDSERGLFAGGAYVNGGASQENHIDYITINTPGNATNFGDCTQSKDGLAGCSNAASYFIPRVATKWPAGGDIDNMGYIMSIPTDTTSSIEIIESGGLLTP